MNRSNRCGANDIRLTADDTNIRQLRHSSRVADDFEFELSTTRESWAAPGQNTALKGRKEIGRQRPSSRLLQGTVLFSMGLWVIARIVRERIGR